MAESAVAQPPQRFYCHKCNVEIENVSSVSCLQFKQNIYVNAMESRWLMSFNFDNSHNLLNTTLCIQEFTCPLCAGGFIEELPPNGSSDRSRSTSSDDVELPGEFGSHRLNERISSLLMSSLGGGPRAMDEDSDHSSNHDGSSSSKFNFMVAVWLFSTPDLHILNDLKSLYLFLNRWPTSQRSQ